MTKLNDILINTKELQVLGDHRGQLVAIEENVDVPFKFKRVFYIYGTQENITRGKHSHYLTKQFLIAVNGSCKVTLDDGNKEITYDLNKPNLGLIQNHMVWGKMHDFSEDCVLLVLADREYTEKDYIRNYNDFIRLTKNDS